MIINILISVGLTIILMVILFSINRGGIKEVITNLIIAVVAGVVVSWISIKESPLQPQSSAVSLPVVTHTAQSSEPIHSEETPIPEENVDFYAEEFIENYLTAMIEDINSNKFSSVVEYLNVDSEAYNEQKNYILSYCKDNEITEEFKDVEILNVNTINKYTVVVDAYETFNITSPARGSRTSSFNTQYTIQYIDNAWKITKIKNE